MKSLLDKDFRYVHSTRTNVAETFARIRREQKEAKEATDKKVAAINRNKGKTCSER